MSRGRRLRATARGLLVAVAGGAVVVALAAVVAVRTLDPGRPVPTRAAAPGPAPSPAGAHGRPSPDPSPSPRSRPSPGPPAPTASPPPAPRPPYAVQQDAITLVDPSRPTPARGSVPGHAGRTLLTVIRRPAGATGPLPLIVFAHGWNTQPAAYEPLLDAWAAAGYLVAAPTFPDSASTLPGTPVSNYPEQARDLSFVATALGTGRAGPVDPGRVAAAGHSDGGTDIALLALNPAYGDSRFRAYLSLSGEIPPAGVAGPWGTPHTGDLLVAVGAHDQYGLFPRATQVFATARTTAKAMLTVAGGDHMGIFTAPTPVAAAMRQETIRFLDAALRPAGATAAQLTTALEPTGDPLISLATSPAG